MKYSPMDRMKAAQLLEQAKALLGPNGEHWLQEEYNDQRGQYCAIGAIEKVGDEEIAEESALAHEKPEVRLAVAAMNKACGGNTPDYNDDEKRTFADISKKFDKAIEIARKG